jgi:Trypsin/Tachylectin
MRFAPRRFRGQRGVAMAASIGPDQNHLTGGDALSIHRTRRWVAALAGTVVAAGLVGGGSAGAVAGAEPVPDGTYGFTAKITFGDVHACTGALVDKYWVVTAKSCFAEGAAPVAPGPPARPSTAVVGRTNLTGTAGHEVPIVTVIPHPDRNLALARLSVPVTDIAPVALATSAPAATETLTVAGYGRTTTEWIPDRLHAATFTVQGVAASAVDLIGATAGAGICKGDAGGPAFRTVAGAAQLVALNNTSWQKGCLGETPTSDGATATRLDDLGAWVREQMADVQIFGILPDGRLTYDAIDSASGDLRASRRSTATLGFTPQAMATLNADTILVTSTGGQMYRVDITNLNPLTFTPVSVGTGWSPYDRITYDGYGSFYYINGETSTLYRRTVTKAKPASNVDLTRGTEISGGWGLKSITSPGAGRILANVADGRLLSYKVNGTGTGPDAWMPGELAKTGWGAPTHLVSPGGGFFYARSSTGRLDRYRDLNPFDGKGTDIQSFPNDPVSTSGWDQVLLSARPWTGLVSVYGTRPDGRLSYTALDPVTGATKIRTVSTQTLGFTPKAMATLNSDTLLVSNTVGDLYRVDITSTQPLTFTRTANSIDTGWTHDRLVYDGFGSLFGRSGARLLRYTVAKPKPASRSDLPNGTEIIGSGFPTTTLAATGKGHLLASSGSGRLIAYTVTDAGAWSGKDLAASGWSGYTLFSPGGGLYYRRDANAVVTGFVDVSPFDGSGADLTAYVPTGTTNSGWDPILSAQPYDSWPDNLRSAW